MKNLFEFPDHLRGELKQLHEGYKNDLEEASLDRYVRKHASREFVACWETNMKRLKEEREKDYIIN